MQERGRWLWAASIVLVLALHASALLLLHRGAAAPHVVLVQPVMLELAPAPPPPPTVTQPLPQRPLAPAHVETPSTLRAVPVMRQAAVVLPAEPPKPPHAPPAPSAPQPIQAVQPAQRAPAPVVPPTPAVSAAMLASWQARLVAHIERFKNFPAAAQRRHEQGVVMMRFSMSREGHVMSTAMVQGSGYADLDTEARAWIERADPMPTPPGQGTVEIVLPLHFSLR